MDGDVQEGNTSNTDSPGKCNWCGNAESLESYNLWGGRTTGRQGNRVFYRIEGPYAIHICARCTDKRKRTNTWISLALFAVWALLTFFTPKPKEVSDPPVFALIGLIPLFFGGFLFVWSRSRRRCGYEVATKAASFIFRGKYSRFWKSRPPSQISS